jgi:hypothetical protein
MGNRVNEILEKLVTMRIISDKLEKQPRVVLPNCVEDIPDEALAFLYQNKVLEDDIIKAIQERH